MKVLKKEEVGIYVLSLKRSSTKKQIKDIKDKMRQASHKAHFMRVEVSGIEFQLEEMKKELASNLLKLKDIETKEKKEKKNIILAGVVV